MCFVGFGIFVTKDIDPGSFLCEYDGELLSNVEGEKRSKEGKLRANYLFYLHHKCKKYWYVYNIFYMYIYIYIIYMCTIKPVK